MHRMDTHLFMQISETEEGEVDTISGSVVEAAKDLGISVPYHEMVVQIIHAMEERGVRNDKHL